MMQWQSPAKINLHLRVGAMETVGSGFHQVNSWMVTVGLFDKLSFEFAPHSLGARPIRETCIEVARLWNNDAICDLEELYGLALTLECDDPSIPTNSSNLIVRAVKEWFVSHHFMPRRSIRETYEGDFGVVQSTPAAVTQKHFLNWAMSQKVLRVALEKRIPAGGGLGGGSSNAATTLLALNAHLNEVGLETLDRTWLEWMGLEIGSDVPFFFDAPSALSSGRGEKIVRVASPKPKAVMLFLPPFGISTASAYRVLDQLRPHAPEDALDPIDVEEWTMLSAAALLPRLRNDLELAAFHLQPQLGELREMLERKLERPVRMSGSGSTLFTLYDTELEAQEAIQKNLGSDFGLVKVRVCSLGSARIEQII